MAGQTGKEASVVVVGKETEEEIAQEPGEDQRAAPGSVRVCSGWLHFAGRA